MEAGRALVGCDLMQIRAKQEANYPYFRDTALEKVGLQLAHCEK